MCADKHQSFYKLALLFLVEVARYIPSTQNRKLVIFAIFYEKRISTAFVFYCDAKYSDILWGPVMFSVTCDHLIFHDTTLKS